MILPFPRDGIALNGWASRGDAVAWYGSDKRSLGSARNRRKMHGNGNAQPGFAQRRHGNGLICAGIAKDGTATATSSRGLHSNGHSEAQSVWQRKGTGRPGYAQQRQGNDLICAGTAWNWCAWQWHGSEAKGAAAA